MKVTSLRKSGLLFLLAVLFLPCLAHATVLGTVDLLYAGIGARDSMTVWGGNAQGTSLYAGNYMFQKISGTGQGNLWNNLDIMGAVCIELSEPLAGNPITTYNVINTADGPVSSAYPIGTAMGTTKAKYLQELWGRYYDPSWSSVYNTTTQNIKAAVFAMAAWEIVYEDYSGNPLNWDVTVDGTPGDGGFAADYTYSYVANNWLHSLDGTGPRADLRVFSIDGKQDFIVAVPEPMTIILLSTGSLIILRRKWVA